MIRKYNNHKVQANPWHREEESHNTNETPGRQTKQSNQLSLPHLDDCKTRRAIKKRTTKHRTITESKMGVTINNKPTITEPPPYNGQQPKPPRGLNAFYWYQIFALDSAGVEVQKLVSLHGSLLTIAMYDHGEPL